MFYHNGIIIVPDLDRVAWREAVRATDKLRAQANHYQEVLDARDCDCLWASLGLNSSLKETLLFDIFTVPRVVRELLLYFSLIYKPEYAVNPTQENQLIHIDTTPGTQFADQCLEELEDADWRRSFFAMGLWDVFLKPGSHTEHKLAVLLVMGLYDHLEKDIRGDGRHLRSGKLPSDREEVYRRLAHFVEWFRNELRPERWEHSVVPYLLGLRRVNGEIQGFANGSHLLF